VVDDEASRNLETRLSMIVMMSTAADGEEALDTFRKADPDLVVFDVDAQARWLRCLSRIT